MAHLTSAYGPAVEQLEPRMMAAGDLSFAVTIGGNGADGTTDVAVDRLGNAYVSGRFTGAADFGTSAAGVQRRTAAGGSDAYVAKYAPGGALLWVRTVGGAGDDEAMALAVDSAGGGVIVTGFFGGTADFDPGPDALPLTSSGPADAFVLKLTSGGGMAWVRQLSGPAEAGGTAVALDAAGGVYVLGMFSGRLDLDPGLAEWTVASQGGYDVFLAKLTPGGSLVYGRSFGGLGADFANGVAAGGSGHVYLTGSFFGRVDFEPGAGATWLTAVGSSDVFASELDAAGRLVWARSVGGPGADQAGDIAADASGNVFLTGNFTSAADFDPGRGISRLTSSGDTDAFVLKLTASANLAWARRFGGPGRDRGADLALDPTGGLHVTGHFAGEVDFDPGKEVRRLYASGGSDAFVVRLSNAGLYGWARQLGGPSSADVGEGICVGLGPHPTVYVVGRFAGTVDFDPAPAASRRFTSAGGGLREDGYLWELLGG